jgi:hypothetical protein
MDAKFPQTYKGVPLSPLYPTITIARSPPSTNRIHTLAISKDMSNGNRQRPRRHEGGSSSISDTEVERTSRTHSNSPPTQRSISERHAARVYSNPDGYMKNISTEVSEFLLSLTGDVSKMTLRLLKKPLYVLLSYMYKTFKLISTILIIGISNWWPTVVQLF